MCKQAFVASFDRACDLAGGSPTWERCKDMTLAELTDLLAPNGVRLTHASHDKFELFHAAAELAAAAFPFLPRRLPPATQDVPPGATVESDYQGVPLLPPLVIVYDSINADSHDVVPVLWGPRSLRGTKCVTLDKNEDDVGRDTTQPAEIDLLENCRHPSYPDYIKL